LHERLIRLCPAKAMRERRECVFKMNSALIFFLSLKKTEYFNFSKTETPFFNTILPVVAAGNQVLL
jgi:hypothetical protein